MQFKNLEFTNAAGQKLSARLDLPLDRKPVAYALFAHCFTCSKNIKAIGHISRALTMERIAVLRFDFTGLGESEGDFADTNFSSNVEDLVWAAEFMRAEYEAPMILIGHSLGGAAVLQAAARIPSSRAVVTIAAPADPGHVKFALGHTKEIIERQGEAKVDLAGRTFKIKKQFLEDLEAVSMQSAIANLNRALLIFHSPTDDVVAIENAARIYQTARHPKSFISLDQADHLLMNPRDSLYVGSVIAAWTTKYIDVDRQDAKKAQSIENPIVTRTGQSGLLTDIQVNDHSMVADEPLSVGGSNLGPTPYDFLVAGLGACTSMTLRLYADRKGWPLDSVTVRLKHKKIHADDCETCVDHTGMLDKIDRDIELTGPLDIDQKRRLLEIADKCPVHRTLQSEIHINTNLTQ